MDTTPVCPVCGKSVVPGAPQGLCPECLMKSGFETQRGNEPVEGKPGFAPPSVEEMARLFPQLEIIELLGRGGMGAVYKARQPRLNRFVALKILSPEKQNDPQFAERFEREARALASLTHPNIVAVYDFGSVGQASRLPSEHASASGELRTVQPTPSAGAGETPALHYLLMEFVDGLTLRQLLQARKLSPAEALGIVPKICEALQYAHEQGVIHRDMKPENILLDKKGQVKIADFGIAKIMDLGPGDLSLTRAKDVVGTPHYMAPEQIEKPQSVDSRADIYSLGVVFYEMLTGELPLGKFQPPSSRMGRIQIDVRLDEVVLHALEKEPDRRYQQVSEVKTDVETIARSKTNLKPKSKLSMKTLTILLTVIAILSIALVYEIVQTHKMSQALEPVRAQQARENRQRALRGRFENRMMQDKGKYTVEQLREAESLMQTCDEKLRTPEATESCQALIRKYPDSDRAGCAMLYLAQISQGDERARYLQDCIEKYNDCFYGDGVQVGAYARYLLAEDYKSQGETAKAEALFNEIKAKYPDAIDHHGNLLVDSLKTNPK